MIDPPVPRATFTLAALAALALTACTTEDVNEDVFDLNDPGASNVPYGMVAILYAEPTFDKQVRVQFDGLPVIESWISGDPAVAHSEYLTIDSSTTTGKLFPVGIHTFQFEDPDGNLVAETGPVEVIEHQELGIAIFGDASSATINVFPTHFLEPIPELAHVNIMSMRWDGAPMDIYHCPPTGSPPILNDCELLLEGLQPGELYSADHARSGSIVYAVDGESPHGLGLSAPCRKWTVFPMTDRSGSSLPMFSSPMSCEGWDDYEE